MRETEYVERNGGDSGNILLHPPDASDHESRPVLDVVRDTTAPLRVLVVTVEHSIEEWLSTHQDIGDWVDELVILGVGDGARSTATAQPSATTTTPAPAPVPGEPVFEFITDAGDLSTLGQTINAHLQTREHATDDTQTILYVDSISALLESADTETVFRFLHTLTSLVTAQGATAYYQLNPSQIDAQTTATLSVLFDSIDD